MGLRNPENARPKVRLRTKLRQAQMQKLYLEGYTVEEISGIMDRGLPAVKEALEFMPKRTDPEWEVLKRAK